MLLLSKQSFGYMFSALGTCHKALLSRIVKGENIHLVNNIFNNYDPSHLEKENKVQVYWVLLYTHDCSYMQWHYDTYPGDLILNCRKQEQVGDQALTRMIGITH